MTKEQIISQLETRVGQLTRERDILYAELHMRLSAEHWDNNHDMSEEEADRLATRDLTHLINHNEGAE